MTTSDVVVDETQALLVRTDVLALSFSVSKEAPVGLIEMKVIGGEADAPPPETGIDRKTQPLVEIRTAGTGTTKAVDPFGHSVIGSRLRYADHEQIDRDGEITLIIRQSDPASGLHVSSTFVLPAGRSSLRTWTTVQNVHDADVYLQAVSSFAASCLIGDGESTADVSLLQADAEWVEENRWSWTRLAAQRGGIVTRSLSTWSTGEFLPNALLVHEPSGRSWAWQIEHNGAWRWEIQTRREHDDRVALILSGPNDDDHQWSTRLRPGESFTSVPVSVAVSDAGYEGALGVLTAHRRASRRSSPADAELPVIYNDFMNTLMGDPTREKLIPLIDAAAEAGAEVFCIDAGWYADFGAWWDSIGEWMPSETRFGEAGLAGVLDRIRHRGMIPGLWIEPESIGIDSPAATELPEEAFLQRFGERVLEQNHYHLDLRHPTVTDRLDRIFDRMIHEWGVGFIKVDYNITPGAGSDYNALTPGEALLDHNRAHLAWLDRLFARHPHVIFENCASGGMRADYALLSRFDLQSTSDQQDAGAYASIAASSLVSILPEQAANWAYPVAGSSPEEIAFTMVNGLAGRLYLSGFLDAMNEAESALVAEGVSAYKAIRHDTATASPFWPLGIPEWNDEVIVVGLRSASVTYLVAWSRNEGAAPVDIALPHLAGRAVSIDVVYPSALGAWPTSWRAETGMLTVSPPTASRSARVFRLT